MKEAQFLAGIGMKLFIMLAALALHDGMYYSFVGFIVVSAVFEAVEKEIYSTTRRTR